jgi:GTP-sensing pleiotropic transcriptional regulator CodY
MKVQVRYLWGREDLPVKTAIKDLIKAFKPLAGDIELLDALKFLEKEFSDEDFVRFTHAYLLWGNRLEEQRKTMSEAEYRKKTQLITVVGGILTRIIAARGAYFQRAKKD